MLVNNHMDGLSSFSLSSSCLRNDCNHHNNDEQTDKDPCADRSHNNGGIAIVIAVVRVRIGIGVVIRGH